MLITDPIADMLTRIRNALIARHDEVDVPLSTVKKAIAEILRSCPDLRLRIAGYTDSQGREESNLRLSQERAEAVLGALRAERVPVAGFEAQGYGEASPIA